MMTALSEMQKDWMENAENNLMTGVLFWDLSAAFANGPFYDYLVWFDYL